MRSNSVFPALHECVMRVVEGPWFRHSGARVPRLHQGDEAHGPLDRVGFG